MVQREIKEVEITDSGIPDNMPRFTVKSKQVLIKLSEQVKSIIFYKKSKIGFKKEQMFIISDGVCIDYNG